MFKCFPWISIFEPHASGCAWSQIDTQQMSENEIAIFPNDCENVQVSWHPFGNDAIVWYSPEDEASEEGMLLHVNIRYTG